jgi:hypothetical protein
VEEEMEEWKKKEKGVEPKKKVESLKRRRGLRFKDRQTNSCG